MRLRWAITLGAAGCLLAGCSKNDLYAPAERLRGTSPHVPPKEQAALPTEKYVLFEFTCFAPVFNLNQDPPALREKRRRQQQRFRRRFDVLRHALQTHPDHLVTASYSLADVPAAESHRKESISVRELAESFLSPYEDDPLDTPITGCERRYIDELAELLEKSG